MEAKKAKLWQRRLRTRKTGNSEGEEGKNKTTCQ